MTASPASPTPLRDLLAALYQRTGGYSIRLGLDTTRALLAELGVDPLALPCVHLAGTNGKGSTAAMLAAICSAAGLRTGLYTSPHLFHFSERIRIDGIPIPDDVLSDLIDQTLSADARQAAAPDARPATFFELATAIAFKYFLDQHVHLAILETGMGGRLDATNVVDPLASVILPIGLEHTAYLGNTLAAIATEKGGIIKPRRPVVIGAPQAPEALAVLLDLAARRQAPVLHAAEQVSIRATPPRPATAPDAQTLHIQTPDSDLPPVRLHLPGAFQLDNAACAITTILYLRSLGLPLPDAAIVDGLSRLRWPGRLQRLSDDPPTYLDVAHNPHAAAALAAALRPLRRGRPLFLLCGLLTDKDAPAYFRALRPVVDRAFLVGLPPPRGTDPSILLAAATAAGIPAEILPLGDALPAARAAATSAHALLLLAGSFHLPAALGLPPS